MYYQMSIKKFLGLVSMFCLLSVPLMATGSQEKYRWPTNDETKEVWLSFGWGKHPLDNGDFMNPGVYLLCKEDAPITAIADGVILYIAESRYSDLFLGNELAVYHKEGITSRYSNISIKERLHPGSRVRQGEVLGWAVKNLHYDRAFVFLELNRGRSEIGTTPSEYIDPFLFILKRQTSAGE